MAVEERVVGLGGIAALVTEVEGSFGEGLQSVDVPRAIEAAAELCCRYAPDAPDAVLKESVARTAGYLLQASSGQLHLRADRTSAN